MYPEASKIILCMRFIDVIISTFCVGVCVCVRCISMAGIREQVQRLQLLPIDDVAQDAGRLLFLLDDCLHNRLTPAFSDLLASQPSASTKDGRASAGCVYISYAKGDEKLALDVATALRREGIEIVSRESAEARHQISERRPAQPPSGSREADRSSSESSKAPSTSFQSGFASRMNVGGFAVNVHGPLESMKAYGTSVRGMCSAILRADVILVIASQCYFESFKCRLEANYLSNQKVGGLVFSCECTPDFNAALASFGPVLTVLIVACSVIQCPCSSIVCPGLARIKRNGTVLVKSG